MPKVNAKRQITLPIMQCKELGIEPGDEVECFVGNGQLTIVKKLKGAAAGILKNVKAESRLADEESLQSAVLGDETSYLLASSKNTDRLQKSIDEIDKGLKALKGIVPALEKPVSVEQMDQTIKERVNELK